jgi:ERCC4-type nuclease
LFRLKEAYPKSLILLEGYLPIIYKYSHIQPAAVWGAMFNLAKNGIAIVNTASQKETSISFTSLHARTNHRKKDPIVHAFKKTDKQQKPKIFHS